MAEDTAVSDKPGDVLLVADHSPRIADLLEFQKRDGKPPLLLLDVSADEQVDCSLPDVLRLRIDDLLNLSQLHREFLDFLQRWPRETLVDGLPFDDLFRHTSGDSLWWVGPGSQRHPFSGSLFPIMKGTFLLRAACERYQPSLIVICTSDRRPATVLHSFCVNTKRRVELLPGSARPLSRPGRASRTLWTVRTTLALLMLPIWIVLRAVFARLVTRRARQPEQHAPSIVMTGWYPNHVRDDDTGQPHVWYWQKLAAALKRQSPDVSVHYLLHTTTFRFDGPKRLLRPFYPGWHRLRHLNGLLPLTQTYGGLREYFRGAVRQWRLMGIYRRLEASAEFGRSCEFAGADVSCLLVGSLRTAVATVAKWSRNVAATAASLQSARDVRVVLVHEEFYPKGMLTIAAARSLGLPTLGVQHGAIGPQHTVYMPPQGSLTGAPVPDSFAAYGEFAAEVLSKSGAYPRERIFVVGAPRFDALVTSPPNLDAARERLGWPMSGPVILLTTETFRLSGGIYRGLIELARANPSWHVAVKLHPHERDPEAYRELFWSASVTNVELCRDRLLERLAGCDVLVTGYSTTALEGLLLDKRVVCADFTTAPDRYPLVTEGVALPARDGEQLEAAVPRALQCPLDPACRRQFLQRHLGPTADGNGAQAFASLVVGMFLEETADKQTTSIESRDSDS